MSSPPKDSPSLERNLGLFALVVYGVGDMLGSGIYALIGQAALLMGNAAWLGFVVSMVAALLTGLSYASLGSRYPRAAGAAYITQRAFGFSFLTYVLGLSVVASGLTSFATQSRAFAGYFVGWLGVSPSLGVVVALGFISMLTIVNLWGMRESALLNLVCTSVEVAGLLLVIAVGLKYWGRVDYLEVPARPEAGGLGAPLVLSGAVLTFYSFIGFEDMINVAEEVKNPRRNFPIAVIAALAITTVVYIGVSVTAVSVMDHAELGRSSQPLVAVVAKAAPTIPPALFSLIALFAIANTGLVNYIMGSRMVYGMARQGLLPAALGRLHERRRTPHVAIFTLMAIVMALSVSGNIGQLASATSAILLSVFIVVNAALIRLQGRADEPKGGFEIPRFVPALGIVVNLVMLLHASAQALVTAALLMAGIALLYAILRPQNVVAD
jgi:basic amino acid/polyamine antiporter, APA family